MRVNGSTLDDHNQALKNIHKQYYEEYDNLQSTAQGNGERRTPDLTELIPRLKVHVLKGVNILFTHVIPTHQKKESSEAWILATEFGAECSANWNSKVTHLVAGDRGTEKVREAKKKGNVFIVSKEWLDESIKKWERQPEKAFMFEEGPQPESESGQVSEIEKLNIETADVTDEEGGNFLLSSEKLGKIDWGDVIKEIDDEIGDSGDTSAFDESENESGTESNGRKKLKRNNEGQLVVSERYSKRMKQSPLRQSIMFDEDEDDEDDETNVSLQEFDADVEPNTGFERSSEPSSESFYQHSEPQEDFPYDNDIQGDDDHEYDDYDLGNQSDDEDSDDEKFIHDFEESLKQDRVDDVFNGQEKDDEHLGIGD